MASASKGLGDSMAVAYLAGFITDGEGKRRWDVYCEVDGTYTVERDAPDGSEDTHHGSLSDVIASLPDGFTFRGKA